MLELKPAINYKKAINAIATYCPFVKYEDILVLIDDTFLRNGKAGLVLTKDWLVAREKFGTQQRIEINNIETLILKSEFSGTDILVNDNKFTNLTYPDFDELAFIFGSIETLRKYIKSCEKLEG